MLDIYLANGGYVTVLMLVYARDDENANVKAKPWLIRRSYAPNMGYLRSLSFQDIISR